ncbi:hypothetical protein [[Clostridium] polysaccharolyticum]|uniref:Uncharacterized protein n=1 Tax=[Clostridium] polysaccharolyticum TaxID=29364 RepID=A0A1H9Y7G5_9FIRM|nr:hypothetical protein [[Clostridium] polysaccharolyticum]SES64853.1 hypothetical protein SAMN04487772_101196 [[Clostridium] polysaccharolyticum]
MKIKELTKYKQGILNYCVVQSKLYDLNREMSLLSEREPFVQYLETEDNWESYKQDVAFLQKEQEEIHKEEIAIEDIFHKSFEDKEEEKQILYAFLTSIAKVYDVSHQFNMFNSDFIEILCNDKLYEDLEIAQETLILFRKNNFKYIKEEAEKNEKLANIEEYIVDPEIEFLAEKEAQVWWEKMKEEGIVNQEEETMLKDEGGNAMAEISREDVSLEEYQAWEESKDKYLTSDAYNKQYAEAQSNAKEPKQIEADEKREKHPETLLANQVSIMDFAKKNHFVIRYEDEKIAKVQDIISEGEITVFKENNTWSIPENGTTTGGRTIRFVARMLEMNNYAASDMLVENRAKYSSSKEYNEEYAKQHSKQKESKAQLTVQEEETMPKEEGGNAYVETQSNVKEPEKQEIPQAEVQEQKEIPLSSVFSKIQIAEILAGAKRGLDIKVYNKIELSAEQMHELRLGLEKDINLSEFAYKQVPANYLKEVRLAKQDGLDIKVFALKDGKCTYTAEQAREIRLGLKAGLSQEQMNVFSKKDLKPDVMKELRLGLQNSLNVMADFNNGLYTAKDIHTVRMHLMVKQFLESLKQKMAMLFEQVKEAIRTSIEKQKPESTAQEVMEETDLQVKDTVKALYEAIEESISEKDIETKKEILAGVFEKVVAIGNAIEELYPDKEKGEVFQEVASRVEETIYENTLKDKALNALKIDYAEKFAESEQQHNMKIVEITEQLMKEPITKEQKKEVLLDNLNYEISESAIESLMEYMPQTADTNMMNQLLQNQQNIIEHSEEFELEQ